MKLTDHWYVKRCLAASDAMAQSFARDTITVRFVPDHPPVGHVRVLVRYDPLTGEIVHVGNGRPNLG